MRVWQKVAKAVACAVALLILYLTFRDVDAGAIFDLIGSTHGAVALALIPYLVAISFDTMGWREVFKNLGRTISFGSLLSIRLSAEALLMSLPGGAFVAESSKPALLKARFGVPLTEGLASVAAGKCLVAFTHGLYIGIALLVGWEPIARSSVEIIGIPGLEWLMLGSTFGLVGIGVVMGAGFLFGSVAERSRKVLAKIPSARFRAWLDGRAHRFLETDQHFVASLDLRSVAVPVAYFLVAWMVEAVETFFILKLLGVDLHFAQVISFEVILSLIRSLVFFVPAGLGIQDFGYVAFLKAYGVDDAVTVGAAFVLVKRSKELLWIVVGYLLLLAGRSRPKAIAAHQAL